MDNFDRYFLEISYKGTAYHGWQTQPNAITVQEVLNKALHTFFRKPIETLGCGRTDAGVNATQFYLHFDLENDIAETDFSNVIKSLNGLLPYDIAIKNIIKVKNDAHARFDAVSRSYQYHIHFNKNPFKTETSWLVRDQLNVASMNFAAAILMQYEDFGAFCKANADNFTNICKITKAEWEVTHEGLIFHISANRFLRNMVRAIVGTLVEVGKGKLKSSDLHLIIQSQNRSSAGASVPACGLFLTSVKYPYIK
ncbi:tRNA pseudouridine(38-40) synthase TruA [Pedobacter sp. SD-b]|uniref:tRNA pseudouridine synthase A n=1 Tax=Pedobacter segetis TaxID=2793069 RepID=A0ABS1BMP0_9SPHI|nr:tRNA pseudouridine(38-40) synthase TruA [Pedobacter segetis]MBK0384169.1 tRNA pseudouridine(38-40) synthase TruA [Pedobacter segetis]